MAANKLVSEMKAAAESRKNQAERIAPSSPLLPEPHELPPALNPDNERAAFQRDWERIVLSVQHGLALFEHFNAVLDAHQREPRTPESEPATEPRARAQRSSSDTSSATRPS